MPTIVPTARAMSQCANEVVLLAIWRLGVGLRYGEVWGHTTRFEGPNLENYCKGHSIRKLWLGSLNLLTVGRLGT